MLIKIVPISIGGKTFLAKMPQFDHDPFVGSSW